MELNDRDKIDMYNMMVGIRKMILKRKKHIKKYYKYRKIHGEVLDSMLNYIYKGKYKYMDKYESILDDLRSETRNPNFEMSLNPNNADDETVITELFCYDNHPNIDNLTDIFIKNNKFKNKDKLKMLEAMKNSYVGLFKIIKSDDIDGYLYIEDVFTKKKFKIIDVSLSLNDFSKLGKDLYYYNRIITIDDISFSSGIHSIFTSKNTKLMEYIKKHRYKKVSNFARCIQLYKISKKETNLVITYNNQY